MPDCLEYFNFEFWWMSGSKLRIADTCFCQEYIADRYWPSRDRTGGGVKRSRPLFAMHAFGMTGGVL
jgi:hypothetical protein